jgi:hypothetical protein
VLAEVMVAILLFYLAGIHNNRFKTFIAMTVFFCTQNMFGTTEEFSLTTGILVEPYWEKII